MLEERKKEYYIIVLILHLLQMAVNRDPEVEKNTLKNMTLNISTLSVHVISRNTF